MFDPLLAGKLVYVFGILNLLSLSLVFFSCRCLVGHRFVEGMLKQPWYRWYYARHCVFWYIFFASVLFHSVLAITAFGNPLF